MIRPLTLTAIGLLLSFQVNAKEGDTFRPYVQVSLSHDDNLYKADSDSSIDVPSLSDTIRTIAAGLDVNFDYSKQNFILNTEVANTHFSKNDRFDNQSGSFDGAWNWKIGRQLVGNFQYDYSKIQASFVDNQALALEGADKVNQTLSYTANWLINPSWTAGIGLSGSTLDFINTDLEFNNRESRSANVNVNYKTTKGSKFGFKVRRDTTNLDRQNNAFTESNYTLSSYVLTTDWNVSGKSRLQGEAGWESLKNQRLSQRDFSDWSMNLTHIWMPTGKYSLRTKVWNEVNPSNSLIATYQRTKGIKLSATWNLSTKNFLNFSGERKNNDLEGDPGFISSSEKLRDRYLNASAAWGYRPVDNIDMQLGYQYSKRQSTANNRDFKSNSVFALLKATW